MGFLDLLGHAAIQAMRDAEKETKRHNQLCYQLSDYEVNLNNYLERVGCGAIYTADWGCIDTGSISLEKKKMDTISQKVEKYIELGGNPKYIHDLDEIDDCIEKVKYLKTKNALHRQQEFEYQESYWVKDDIECEEKEKREITRLLNAQGNELSAVVDQGECLFVPFYDVNDPEETIRVDIAKNYNEDTDQFLEYYTVSLKFNKSGYYVYSYDDQSSLYFKSSIGKNQSVEVASVPIPALRDWSMLVINGLELLCSTELADSVRDLYVEHNMSIIEEENSLSVLTASNINDLSGSEFERLCQKLIENMGFDTEITKESRDGGIDLIAYNHQPLLSGKYIIQCKRYAGSVGEPILRDLYGVVTSERANKGILMTTGYFTKSAIAFAEGKPLELIDGKAMLVLIEEYETSSDNFICEKSFEEIKAESICSFAEKLDLILEDLTDTRSREEKFLDELTAEERVEYEKRLKLAYNRMEKEQNQVLNNKDVGGRFIELLRQAQDQDGYYVSDEIANHYIEHMNCIFQLVTDQTTLTVYDMREKEVFSRTGTFFIFIFTKEPEGNAKIEDIINKKRALSLCFEWVYGLENSKYKMDITNNFDLEMDDTNKTLALSNSEHKVIIYLPYKNDYKNAADYLYILNRVNAF